MNWCGQLHVWFYSADVAIPWFHSPHANALTFCFNVILSAHRQKYGLAYVDFNDPERPRTLKQSASFIQEVTRTRYVRYVQPV